MDDRFDLARFVEAQAGVHERALAELRAGRKRSHWMWFVFPQIAGLGFSPMAQRYAISSLDEAAAYLAHPLLGPRLVEAVQAALNSPERKAQTLFGTPDDLKFRSSLTLFAEVPGAADVFRRGLERFFAGDPDPATLLRLQAARAERKP